MSTDAYKQEIAKRMVQIEDEQFLSSLLAMLESYIQTFDDPIIGYELDGKPVHASTAKAQFAEDLRKPETFMSVEDFEKELDEVTAA